MPYRRCLLPIILLFLLVPFGAVLAEDDFEVTVAVDFICDEATMTINIDGGTGPFSMSIDFGDEDEPMQMQVDTFPLPLSHTYPGQGEYEISVKVVDSQGLEGEYEQEIVFEGPEVTLESEPSPPLLTLDAGEATITFIAIVDGGTEPYGFEWDLDGDGTPENVDSSLGTAEFAYTEPGEYKATLKVTDGCGFSDSDKLKVIVLDDDVEEDEEEDSEEACHPTAEKIAHAVSSLTNKEQPYTCETIYAIFRGSLTGGAQLGFGRMWHAYKMAIVIDELSWEDILDWKLEASGWGVLNQLYKFAESVDEIGISELVELVLEEGKTVGEIRTAMRMTLRYDAEFYDALGRISEGASKGELGQFYKLAQEIGINPNELDVYLEGGASLSEVRHASKFSDRTGATLDEILMAHTRGNSWGEINQAHWLADEGMDVASILEMGVNEYRQQLREEGRLERMNERDERIADRFSEEYGTSPDEVIALYNGDCDWKWACVRKILRNRIAENASSDRDERTLDKIATQYGVEPAVVSAQLSACSGDWSCVRAHFRDLAKGDRGKN